MLKSNLKKRLAGLGAATVVVGGAIFGGVQIHKNNQEKEALEAQRQALIGQIQSNPILKEQRSYVYSDELKAFQRILNKQLSSDKQIKEDGMLPNLDRGSRKEAEFEIALKEMSKDDLKVLATNLSEKIDIEILDGWSKGDISKDARSTFFRMIERRLEKNGQDGSTTREIQRALNACGANLKVDGKFGSNTQGVLDKVFASPKRLKVFAKAYKIERDKTDALKAKNLQKSLGR